MPTQDLSGAGVEDDRVQLPELLHALIDLLKLRISFLEILTRVLRIRYQVRQQDFAEPCRDWLFFKWISFHRSPSLISRMAFISLSITAMQSSFSSTCICKFSTESSSFRIRFAPLASLRVGPDWQFAVIDATGRSRTCKGSRIRGPPFGCKYTVPVRDYLLKVISFTPQSCER